jgi:flagellar motor switch protein FliN/FliY
MPRELNVRVEMGRARMAVDELAALEAGSVIELDASADDEVDVYVDDCRVARGEAVVVDGELCVRIRRVVDDLPALARRQGPGAKE